jgi:Na+/phosphate symporter
MIIYLSLLVALVGLLMYALCVNPKLAEIGRIMFGCGLLAFLLDVVHANMAVLAR